MKKLESNRKRYAFIDVHNTSNTTEQLLDFSIDWKKLYKHLKNNWKCEKIFFYAGIGFGDLETKREYDELEKLGYDVKSKIIMPYKNKDKQIQINCPKCNSEIIKTIDMGYKNKANCDVDLTVDALNNVQENTEALVFTGDGDFVYLFEELIKRNGISIYIISNTSKNEFFNRRCSGKIKELIKKYKNIYFIDIDNWKLLIQKEKLSE